MSASLTRIKYLLPKYTRGKVLQVGGEGLAYPHFEASDEEMIAQVAEGVADAVFCPEADNLAISHAAWAVKDGGYLIAAMAEDFATILDEIGYDWTVERVERADDSLFIFARKGNYPQPERPKKTACVERQGGFGDMIQAAVVLPQLKAQGFHVTVLTSPKGQDILRHDPNIDDWYIVDTDQIPNCELPEFWRVQRQEFDRFVNLSESVEGTLLAIPGRSNHGWPHATRKRLMNRNYHEWTAELAQVPFKPCQLFYPTPAEKEDVGRGLSRQSFNIVWALAGSSIHKFTPHMDAVIARMMLEMPEARVFFVGDDACQILEVGWENEKRVTRLSGKLSIRTTLALAMASNLVIGPETGVLNAVGMEKDVHKVLLLSHSSQHNLSKHWVNTQSLIPKHTPCYPCHQLHYTTEHCDIDAVTGAARCAANIDAATIYEAVEKVYKRWKRERK